MDEGEGRGEWEEEQYRECEYSRHSTDIGRNCKESIHKFSTSISVIEEGYDLKRRGGIDEKGGGIYLIREPIECITSCIPFEYEKTHTKLNEESNENGPPFNLQEKESLMSLRNETEGRKIRRIRQCMERKEEETIFTLNRLVDRIHMIMMNVAIPPNPINLSGLFHES